MRAFLIAAAATLVASAAYCQDVSGGGGGNKRHRASEQPVAQKPKADEKAYKAALDRIPDGGKYDPWHNVRQ
jgi:hypothetical protein